MFVCVCGGGGYVPRVFQIIVSVLNSDAARSRPQGLPELDGMTVGNSFCIRIGNFMLGEAESNAGNLFCLIKFEPRIKDMAKMFACVSAYLPVGQFLKFYNFYNCSHEDT